MRYVHREVYERLSSDADLTDMLGAFGDDLPAIHSHTAPRGTGSPYVMFNMVASSEVADAQQEGDLQIDVIDARGEEGQSYEACYKIQERLIHLLDRHAAGRGGDNIRFFYDGSEPRFDDDGRIARLTMQFTVRWNRTRDLV